MQIQMVSNDPVCAYLKTIALIDHDNNRTRGWPERDLFVMGAFHPDHAAHNGAVYELYATAEEDTSGA
jgi:hypothetical protein